MRGHEAIIAMPDWARIRRYYRRHEDAILAAGLNAWALDPYQWDFEGGIRLSPIERMFWFDARAFGAVLYPQFPVGRFFVDFANPAARIAIECDGASYHQDPARDDERQAEIESMGWLVFRIGGGDCYRDDTLTTDDVGRSTLVPSPGRELLNRVCATRDIRIGGAFIRSTSGLLGTLSSAVSQILGRMTT